ncbi:hypothetical protein [Methanohalophilus sp.]|uniref:hypothetical protein n=1 Tax=Methanohalophilus sp. TaxID=1966352 RepID=UPI002634BD79|nr:hypothetical protein [Methanohalophilus sp.]MDK2892843.1 hypothetical protein [Methanohalophilus sp.]
MIGEPPLCDTCKHLNRGILGWWKCKAYPDGIPEKIFWGDVDHHKPYKGDNGIQYEPMEE